MSRSENKTQQAYTGLEQVLWVSHTVYTSSCSMTRDRYASSLHHEESYGLVLSDIRLYSVCCISRLLRAALAKSVVTMLHFYKEYPLIYLVVDLLSNTDMWLWSNNFVSYHVQHVITKRQQSWRIDVTRQSPPRLQLFHPWMWSLSGRHG
jgi:hypothetical protein